MPADFEAYFRALNGTPIDDKTEHTDRGALEALLRDAADDAEPGAHVQHEPKRDKEGGGSPDYKVTRAGRITGYVEVKTIDENLSKVLRSDQIKRYRKLSDNIVLTDYLEFVWIKGEAAPVRQRLAHSEDLAARRLALKPERVEAVRLLLRGFFSATPQRISRSEDLALALASRAAMLRDFLSVELQRQAKAHQEGRLHALYDVFRRQVFHELTIGEFANAFAQMLAYGLFLARLNAGAAIMVSLTNVRQHIPGSFSLIRELVRFLEEMEEPEYREIRWVIDEVLSIVNGIDLAAIHESLSFRARRAISRRVRAADEEEHRLFEKDPFVYFYEDFLKAYDPAMRKSRGVYYTPPPVVNFIVRAVDDLLKDRFGIQDGLADHRKVTVLDFACGTGTFLLEVFERIFGAIGGPQAGRADQIVREHLLKNIYGFEYLIAPYTIAHLKLSQYLKDKGHPLDDDERLQVFLTNTLEPIEPQTNMWLPELSHEVEAAQKVKDRPILVITGNPPYQARSKNKGKWILSNIKDYEFVDGEHFGEKKHWLNDDYVKFIRFAQLKMEDVGFGVVAVITNRWWIENVTFRGMRQSLMRTFEKIYILDLGGEAGSTNDSNVFDITKGVAITLLVRDLTGERAQFYSELNGSRLEKYRSTAELSLDRIDWLPLQPSSPHYFLSPTDETGRQEYELWWSIPKIMPLGSTGILTGRDRLAVAFTESELSDQLSSFAAETSRDALRARFGLSGIESVQLADARAELLYSGPSQLAFRPVAYRVFDQRVLYDDNKIVFRRRKNVMQHVADNNIALTVCRLTKGGAWAHAFVASEAVDDSYVSDRSKERAYAYPLRLLPETRADTNGRDENFSNEFRSFLDDRYDYHYGPEEILGYIYAVLYASSYRRRYAEFLKIDFPRIPFPERKADFDALSQRGWALVQAHLLRKVPPPPGGRLGEYRGKGDHIVEQVRYSSEEQSVWINKVQSFAPVPQAVWDFHIGGYQVLDKYLKSRKGRPLSLHEQTHIRDVAEALAFTVGQMEKIDEAYQAAFPNGG